MLTKNNQLWENQQLVSDALEEIIDAHCRYRNFAALAQEAVVQYISDHSQL